MARRSLLFKLPSFTPTSLFAARSASDAASYRSLLSPLRRLCLFFPLSESRRSPIVGASLRCFSDSAFDWRDLRSVETIPGDGCDFKHWFVCMVPPEPNLTRDEIIDRYIKTLAQVVGSEEEARMKIYSVSTKYYFAFGALVSEELSRKIQALPKVKYVLPDSYFDVINKDYGGEPFLDGQAVPYDPKYHSVWVNSRIRSANSKKVKISDVLNGTTYGRGVGACNLSRRPEKMQNVNNTDARPLSCDVPLINSGNAQNTSDSQP